MKPAGCRQKGSGFELDISKKLASLFDLKWGEDIGRSPGSGAYWLAKGDLFLTSKAAEVLPFHFEMKKQQGWELERFFLPKNIPKAPNLLMSWMQQSETQAKPYEFPIIVFSKNYSGAFVMARTQLSVEVMSRMISELGYPHLAINEKRSRYFIMTFDNFFQMWKDKSGRAILTSVQCECGCGLFVQFDYGSFCWNRFIHGHNMKKLPCGKCSREGCSNLVSHAWVKYCSRSCATLDRWADNELRRKMINGMVEKASKYIQVGRGMALPNGTHFEKGYYISRKTGNSEFFQSSYELLYFQILDSLQDVKYWSRCQDRIEYEVDGKVHLYLPDVEIFLVSGEHIVSEVKPNALLDVFEPKRQAALLYYQNLGIKYTIVTESDLQHKIVDEGRTTG